MKKKTNYRRFSSVVLLFLLAPLSPLFSGGQEETDSQQIESEQRITPKLEYSEGNVQIDGIDAEVGQDVPFSSSIKTGEDSYAEISIGIGNILRIQGNSFATLDFCPGVPSDFGVQFQLLKAS